MILLLLVYLGGVLTILSPCILPVLPFVFARAEQPFLRAGLPMLGGMALTFAAVASLAAVGGAWAVHINQYGRVLALMLLAAFALTLLSKRLADFIAKPFVSVGNRLVEGASDGGNGASPSRSFLLGIATGLLWAPCAGPILGLVLTGAAISGPNTHTSLLLFAYAAGAATSLGAALLIGGKVFALMKKSLGAGEWIRRAFGVAILFAVVVIAAGWDTNVLTRLSLNSTNQLEQSLIARIKPAQAATSTGGATGDVASEGDLPSLAGATAWLNSEPLTPQALRGKVVLIDFWTYSCINCLRTLPYVKSWSEKYKDAGLVVIGVHAPEFAFEKELKNVQHAVQDLGVTYPVALDNNFSIWQAFNNQYWPAHYFIDAQGRIRGHHFGEGNYDESEQLIRKLLVEAGAKNLPAADTLVKASGIQVAADNADMQSPETYVGYARADNFAAKPGLQADQPTDYTLPATLALNQWGLQGKWQADKEKAMLAGATGKIAFRFYARDLHLVIGPGADGKPVRFRVLLDGQSPADAHGVDTDENGNGIVREQRLYQLIRQSKDVRQHTFSIEFLDGGAQAFAFTFG
ncbi:DipZ protein [Collimonas arenae]|uniref:DipZ protein n=1 Tax=Collimonas arenae TaxID=279058 RepID=A0A0A1F6M6_9BURK|nr:cytochrome c biogenesis protein DipZ [Collimonas arenae]AIY39460.1 DipZ protein [Collimonas arenae]